MAVTANVTQPARRLMLWALAPALAWAVTATSQSPRRGGPTALPALRADRSPSPPGSGCPRSPSLRPSDSQNDLDLDERPASRLDANGLIARAPTQLVRWTVARVQRIDRRPRHLQTLHHAPTRGPPLAG